jgi:hypothetical protein
MLLLVVNERRFTAALRARDQAEDIATTENIEAAVGEILSAFCNRWLGPENRARDAPRRR